MKKKLIIFFVLISLILGVFITFGYSLDEEGNGNYIPEKLEATDKVTDYEIDLDNNKIRISKSGKDNFTDSVSGKAGIKYDILTAENVPYIDLKLAREITGIDFKFDEKKKIVTAKVPFTFNNATLNANIKISETMSKVDTFNVIGGHLYENSSTDMKHIVLENDDVYIPATILFKIGTDTIYNVVANVTPKRTISITKVQLDMNVHDNTVLY